MSLSAVRTFLALLTVGANAAVVIAVVLIAGSRVSPALAATRDRVRSALAGSEAALAWLVATVATVGSLYLSEGAHLVPCTLCWYQRIAMYPLAVLFLIAWRRRDDGVIRYAAPLASIGLAISGYHYLIQQLPSLDGGACSAGVSCTTAYFREFGFMSIPYMAGSAFALILVILASWASHRRANRGTMTPDPTDTRTLEMP